jgi:protein ImuB
MLWLAVHLPRLSLEVFIRALVPTESSRIQQRQVGRASTGHQLPEGPSIAVCNRLQVIDANDVAQVHGIHRGTKRATALALAPHTVLIDRDTVKESQALLRVAHWLLQFTPIVSLQEVKARHPTQKDTRGVVLDVSGSIKLFGGLETVMTRIRSGLIELGYEAHLACAPTPHGAWILALHQPNCVVQQLALLNARVGSAPIELLSTSHKHLDTLHGLGVRTLKDLAGLPRPGIARRFGPELIAELDRVLGKIPEPREVIEAAREFHLKLELLAQIENAQALLFAGRRMLLELTAWLTVQHAGVRHFTFEALHEDQSPTTIRLDLAEPSRDIDRLTLLLRERLEKVKLPQPTHSLLLSCDEVVGLNGSNSQLFPSPQQTQEGLGRLVERLQAKLGKETVQHMTLTQDHRPENAYRLEPITGFGNTAATKPNNKPAKPNNKPAVSVRAPPICVADTIHTLPRPLWLLPDAIPITERQERPWYRGPLQLLAGPERIEGGWWDDNLVQRDYFIAEDEQAVLYWIYRSRAMPTIQSEEAAAWYVQGVFG